MRWRRLATWLLPFVLGACGGNGCSGCSEIVPKPETPNALMIPSGVQLRVTQSGFDVIADNIIGLMKALFGATAGGAALIDVDKLLPGTNLGISGGLGLFSGKAAVRDLILTLDLAKLSIYLVPNSSPARIRIAIDKADLGVVQGIVFGEASFLGIKSDAACHLKNGVDVGKPNARIATVSATIDLVLGVDKMGKLEVKVDVADPVLHDIGFSTKKDCGLSECKDQLLLEGPCLECGICSTGQLTSTVIATMKNFLEPILSDLMELVANLLIKQILEPSVNGQPLDIELPIDLKELVQGASAQLGALLGAGQPIRIRVRPSPAAFIVDDGALLSRFDSAVFAKAAGCVVDSGTDSTDVFAKLPQGPAPPLPKTMTLPSKNGVHVTKTLDAGALLARGVVEEAVWAVLRSGVLCTSVDAAALYALSEKKIVMVAALLDLALPGLRQIVPPNAPLRMTIGPTASLAEVPRSKIGPDGQGGVLIEASLTNFGIRIEAATFDRWLTLLELRADANIVMAVRVDAQGRLKATVSDVVVPFVKVADSALFPKAQIDTIAGPLAELGLSLLLSEPLVFDVDLDAIVSAVLKLPIHAALIGIQPGGIAQDWLVIGISLAAKAVSP